MSKLFDIRNKLKQKLKALNKNEEEEVLAKLEEVEENISQEVSKDTRDKLWLTLKHLQTQMALLM